MPDVLVHIREYYHWGSVHVLRARQSGSFAKKVLWDGVTLFARAN
jgi:hypothetical protein